MSVMSTPEDLIVRVCRHCFLFNSIHSPHRQIVRATPELNWKCCSRRTTARSPSMVVSKCFWQWEVWGTAPVARCSLAWALTGTEQRERQSRGSNRMDENENEKWWWSVWSAAQQVFWDRLSGGLAGKQQLKNHGSKMPQDDTIVGQVGNGAATRDEGLCQVFRIPAGGQWPWRHVTINDISPILVKQLKSVDGR